MSTSKVEIIYWETGMESRVRIGEKIYSYWGLIADEKEILDRFLRRKQWGKAIKYLKKFSGKDLGKL